MIHVCMDMHSIYTKFDMIKTCGYIQALAAISEVMMHQEKATKILLLSVGRGIET